MSENFDIVSLPLMDDFNLTMERSNDGAGSYLVKFTFDELGEVHQHFYLNGADVRNLHRELHAILAEWYGEQP